MPAASTCSFFRTILAIAPKKVACPLRRRSLCSGIGAALAGAGARIGRQSGNRHHRRPHGRGGRGDARPSPAQGKARAIIWNPCRNPERCRPARARAPRFGSYDRRRVCPEEGKINPMLATAAVLAGAAKMGCRLFQNTEVQAIERRAGGYAAQTNRGAFYAPHVLNASGAWSANVASMVGLRLPTHGFPLQMIVTEPAAPLVEHLLAHANRHLTLKQAVNGNLIIGGGWTAALDPISLRPRVKRDSLEGNLWAAERVLPAVGSINVIRSWAAMNVVIDGAPILGEAPGHPGFFNAVTVNGLTMGPLIGLLNAEIIRTGRCSRNIAPYTLSRF